MDLSLADTDMLVRVLVGSITITGVIGGWVVLAIKRQWSRTEKTFTSRIESLEEDHERDIRYFERRDRDQQVTISELKADLLTCRASLRECERQQRYPPGLQV